MWTVHFGRGFGFIVRQTTKWMTYVYVYIYVLALLGFKSYMLYVLLPEDGGRPPTSVGGQIVYFLYILCTWKLLVLRITVNPATNKSCLFSY